MADTIFMMHGMWGGPWYWRKYHGVLEAQGCRCVATTPPSHDMDLRGSLHPGLGRKPISALKVGESAATCPMLVVGDWLRSESSPKP